MGLHGGRRTSLDDPVFSCFCVSVKNVTITLDEETYRQARLAAAERGTSMSGLVRTLLATVRPQETRSEAVQRAFAAMDAVRKFTAGDRLNREELHER